MSKIANRIRNMYRNWNNYGVFCAQYRAEKVKERQDVIKVRLLLPLLLLTPACNRILTLWYPTHDPITPSSSTPTQAMHSDMGINSLMFTITERTHTLVDAGRGTLFLADTGGDQHPCPHH